MKFTDGITNIFNGMINNRNATSNNEISSRRVSYSNLNEVYKTGLGNAIVSIKSGGALKSSSIVFKDEESKKF